MAIISASEVQARTQELTGRKSMAEFVGEQEMLDKVRLEEAFVKVLTEAAKKCDS